MANEDKDDRLGRLYALAPDQFVAARNALAAELKKEGNAEGARAVKALVKPGFSAWATNQTTRRAPALVAQLSTVTDALGEAQRALGSERDSHDRFQAATAEQRRVLAELVAGARVVLAEAGHEDDGDALEKVQKNLRFGPLSAETRAALEAGRLVRDVAPPGFGAFSGGMPLAVPGDGAAAPRPKLTLVPADSSSAPAASRPPTAPVTDGAAGHRAAAAAEARERARVAAEERRAHQRRLQELEAELRRARADAAAARREHEVHEAGLRKRESRVRAAENELAVARADLTTAQIAARVAADALAAHEEERVRLADELAAAQKRG